MGEDPFDRQRRDRHEVKPDAMMDERSAWRISAMIHGSGMMPRAASSFGLMAAACPVGAHMREKIARFGQRRIRGMSSTAR